MSNISCIEHDRYADTSFAVKDTLPEINAQLFAAMMSRTDRFVPKTVNGRFFLRRVDTTL